MKNFHKFLEQRRLQEADAPPATPTADNAVPTEEPEQDPGQIVKGHTAQLQQVMQDMGQKVAAIMQSAQKILAASPDFEARSAAEVGKKFKPPTHPDFQMPAMPPQTGPDATDAYNTYKTTRKRPASLDEV